jgi:MoxR-like ATPase
LLEQNKSDVNLVEHLSHKMSSVKSELAKVIIGQIDIIDQILIALISNGHCLLVGVPGLAKTL